MRPLVILFGKSRRHFDLFFVLLLCGLGFAACSASDEVDLGTTSELGESDIADDSMPDEIEPEPAKPAAPPADFFPAVRFENGEHESGEQLDAALLEEKLAAASLVAYNNWRTCATLGTDCNYERDVAPTFSGLERVGRGQDHFGYVEGQTLIRGELDNVVVTEVQILDATAPIVGHVLLCVVDSSVALIEAGDGRDEQILDDSVFAYVLGHQIVSDDEGVLTVEAEFNVVPITDDTSLCDEYS